MSDTVEEYRYGYYINPETGEEDHVDLFTVDVVLLSSSLVDAKVRDGDNENKVKLEIDYCMHFNLEKEVVELTAIYYDDEVLRYSVSEAIPMALDRLCDACANSTYGNRSINEDIFIINSKRKAIESLADRLRRQDIEVDVATPRI